MSVTINEIRQARVEAERKILTVLDTFRERTGLSIVGCDVEAYRINGMSGPGISPVISVRLKVEQI